MNISHSDEAEKLPCGREFMHFRGVPPILGAVCQGDATQRVLRLAQSGRASEVRPMLGLSCKVGVHGQLSANRPVFFWVPHSRDPMISSIGFSWVRGEPNVCGGPLGWKMLESRSPKTLMAARALRFQNYLILPLSHNRRLAP